MITNYIKIAWRNLLKHKFNTAINVLGLACGLSFALLIGAFVWQELRVNQNIKHIDRQYLLQSNLNEYSAIGMLSKALKDNYPHLVKEYFRFDGITAVISYKGEPIQTNSIVADSTFFDMFGFQLAAGETHSALKEPNQVVLSAPFAKRLFGKGQAIGEQLIVRNFNKEEQLFTVSGVLEDTGENAVLDLTGSPTDLLLSIQSSSFFKRPIDDWQNLYVASYLELQPGVEPKSLEKPINALVQTHAPTAIAKDYKASLVPLKTYHLEKGDGSMKHLLYTVSVVAFAILLLAVINFVNISINTSAGRLKEIGIRKVIGGTKKQLRIQFIAEALLTVSIAMILSLALFPFLSKVLSTVLGKSIPSLFDLPLSFWLSVVIADLTIGLLAGAYPALRLSSLPTVQSVRGKVARTVDGLFLLRGLISLQFVIALIALISSVIIAQQVSLFFSKNLGYDKDYLLTVQVPRDWTPEGLRHTEVVRQEFANLPMVKNVSISYDIPGTMSSGNIQVLKTATSDTPVSTQLVFSDRHFADTYKIPLLSGSFYSPDEASENTDRIVINEALSEALGYKNPAEAINQVVHFPGSSAAAIAGVTKNFYGGSMHFPVGPMLWFNVKNSNAYRYFSIRLKPGNIGSSLDHLTALWKKLLPTAPFDYTFMDAKLAQQYKTEMQLKQAGAVATVLAMIIVLLGILGLVSHNLQKRVKEIGIRKVLGASVKQIVYLFVRDVYPLFLLSTLVAVPTSYWLMKKWLTNYYIRTELDTSNFLMPILVLGLVTLSVIALQTIKTAINKPVDALRNE
ncbi:ABC transporter permease [Olivibacter sp. XZL3]|uniref:ABC transporter permease n=1 Tax=Olivibacter sp. XZL3 TaxID=1735116 RepID=UPI0010662E0E|nr:ABC transporter permease [Olivibacter sp. XZL3]